MTGGSSGIGEVAVRAMAQSAEHRLVIGARGDVPADFAELPARIETYPLDLTGLDSVRHFAAEVSAQVDRIDVLLLNAGVYRTDVDGRTADGFETIFGVNHLAGYLLLRLLVDRLADGARVVLTTSGVHDPEEKSSFPPPRHADARLLANPERDPHTDSEARTAGRRAYAASKLCAVLTARAFADRPESAERGLTAIAYCPGETPGTGLVRDAARHTRAAWWVAGKVLRRVVPELNSRAEAGRGLADLALGVESPPDGQVYVALRRGRLTFPEPSELARRDDLATALWQDSAELVGQAK